MGNSKSICDNCSLSTICNYKTEFKKFEIKFKKFEINALKEKGEYDNLIKAGIIPEICCPARVVFEEEGKEEKCK